MPTMCQPFLLDASNTDMSKPYTLAHTRASEREYGIRDIGSGVPLEQVERMASPSGEMGQVP